MLYVSEYKQTMLGWSVSAYESPFRRQSDLHHQNVAIFIWGEGLSTQQHPHNYLGNLFCRYNNQPRNIDFFHKTPELSLTIWGNIKVRHEDWQLSPNFFVEAGRNLYTAECYTAINSFRDRFGNRIIGTVNSTFQYSLMDHCVLPRGTEQCEQYTLLVRNIKGDIY